MNMGDSKKILQVRSARQVPVRVVLLDDDIFNHSVDKRAVGWILFDKVCEHLNILEKDYFGLNYTDPTGEKYWLNNDKKIAKQLKGQNWDFRFEVKFYPADPAQLAEDLTRYQLCLQIRRDIVNEKLPCSFVTYTLLGSYTAQSELGDYDTEEFGSGYKYLKDIQFAPHQDKELLMKIAELHRQHKGLTPEDAEVHFLENAKKLAMYGVELHPARDAEGKEIQLGVCAAGLIVYKDKQQINRFVWPKVLKISYRRNKYYIKIRPGEFEEFASLIGFKLPNVKFAKRLWKISVEHHSFFRFREPDAPKSSSLFPRFGSRFRYSGRTQFQTRQIVAEENREAPYFDRVLSKRGTFGGRTDNMRKRDEERQQRRDELRRQPLPPQTKLPPSEPTHEPPRHADHPPEPKHAPPVAPKPGKGKPKPSPRGPPSVDDNASLDRSRGSLNDSFEDVPDRKSKMEKMHGIATPLAALAQSKKEHEQHEEEHRRDVEHQRDREPHHYRDHHRDDHNQSFDREEQESRPMTPEVIDQDYTVLPANPQTAAAMSEKEKKAHAKEEKERLKREKQLEKERKKEEERERKRLEKEKKALLAEEKKAAKQKSKQKGKEKKDPERDVRERRDSRGSNDMGREWDNAKSQEERGSMTPERVTKRLSSFEDIKPKKRDSDDEDRPPTPPAPLPVGGDRHDRSRSGSEGDHSDDDKHKDAGRYDDDEDGEEVSF